MDICPPAIVTAACFIAVVLIDLYIHDWKRAPGHALFGVFAILLMIFICQRASHTVAWILLIAPFALVFIAYILRAYSEMVKYDGAPPQEGAGAGNAIDYGYPCSCCGARPCTCVQPCMQPRPKPKCRPKHKPCNEDSYFELWLTTK